MIIKQSFLTIIKIFIIVICSISTVKSSNFIDKGNYIIDLKLRVEWLKCPVGMNWNEETCIGEPIKLSLEEAQTIRHQVGDELGGEWRLPSKSELKSLICKQCEKVKINQELFPNTPAELFWTSERNWWSPKFFWSVNFYTGHAYGRFVPEKKLFIRFLRDR